MGSHSVTFHPTQANTPRLHPSQTGWYSIGTAIQQNYCSWYCNRLLKSVLVCALFCKGLLVFLWPILKKYCYRTNPDYDAPLFKADRIGSSAVCISFATRDTVTAIQLCNSVISATLVLVCCVQVIEIRVGLPRVIDDQRWLSEIQSSALRCGWVDAQPVWSSLTARRVTVWSRGTSCRRCLAGRGGLTVYTDKFRIQFRQLTTSGRRRRRRRCLSRRGRRLTLKSIAHVLRPVFNKWTRWNIYRLGVNLAPFSTARGASQCER